MANAENSAGQGLPSQGTHVELSIPGGGRLHYDKSQRLGKGILDSEVFLGTYEGTAIAVKRVPMPIIAWDTTYNRPVPKFPVYHTTVSGNTYSGEAYAAVLSLAENSTRLIGQLNRQGIPGLQQLKAFIYPTAEDPTLSIATDYIHGQDLHEALHSHLSQEQMLTIGINLLRTLEGMHTADAATGRDRVIHRDIKPDNIRIRMDRQDNLLVNEPVLMDLSYAIEEQYASRNIPGSYTYSAPEQWMPALSPTDSAAGLHPVTTKTDIYSLGIVLWEAFTGFSHGQFLSHPRWIPKTPQGLYEYLTSAEHQERMQHALEHPSEDGCITDARIAPLIMRAIDPIPANRPSAGELRVAFEQILAIAA